MTRVVGWRTLNDVLIGGEKVFLCFIQAWGLVTHVNWFAFDLKERERATTAQHVMGTMMMFLRKSSSSWTILKAIYHLSLRLSNIFNSWNSSISCPFNYKRIFLGFFLSSLLRSFLLLCIQLTFSTLSFLSCFHEYPFLPLLLVSVCVCPTIWEFYWHSVSGCFIIVNVRNKGKWQIANDE